MPKYPHMGSEWSRLASVRAKLAKNDFLDRSDQAWICELLDSIAAGEDVSRIFVESRKGRPKEDIHFWIACDYAQHIHDALTPAAELVVDRWQMNNADGQGPDTVTRIAVRQRENTNAISALLGPSFAKVIEWHRRRLLTKT